MQGPHGAAISTDGPSPFPSQDNNTNATTHQQNNTQNSPHMPIMNVHERALSVLACRYVDEVVIGAPERVDANLLATFNIGLVARGSQSETSHAGPVEGYRCVQRWCCVVLCSAVFWQRSLPSSSNNPPPPHTPTALATNNKTKVRAPQSARHLPRAAVAVAHDDARHHPAHRRQPRRVRGAQREKGGERGEVLRGQRRGAGVGRRRVCQGGLMDDGGAGFF